ncbi:MAG TPA: amino acid adenylation domain-containing protein, partial [Thermoanaerobaculia bacterium]|nr:amino acid adenylation domain-containing protein [Thermoanaerobaculia bacterium]
MKFGAGFDPSLFARLWQEILDRNPVLRTSLLWEDLQEPVQIVHQRVKLPFEVLDWRGVPEEEKAGKLQAFTAEDQRRGFELVRPPLMRFTAIWVRDDLWHVVWSYHHLILDGWSAGLLAKEAASQYGAAAAGRAIEVQQRRPFRDYVAWLRQQDLSQVEAYWRRVLGGFGSPTPLGIDKPAVPGRRQDFGPDAKALLIPEERSEALKAWARKNRLTLSTVIQGAWALVLSRYSGEHDLVYGLTVSGRPPSIPGVESMLGCFINTLPVRVRVPPTELVLPWLRELQAEQGELRRYEHSPLVDVLGWSGVPRSTPLFESIFVFEGFMDTLHEGVFERTNYPLTLNVGPDREIVLRADFELERFEPEAVERLLGHLETVLASFIANPEQRLEDVEILADAERAQFAAWNRTEVDYPLSFLLHELISQQAERTPEAVAVTYEGDSLTYRELEERAFGLARHLRRLGVGPDDRVGVCAERSLELPVGLVGLLKAGASFVPLDPAYPADRLAYMIEDSGVPVLLTQRRFVDTLPPHEAQVVCLDEPLPAWGDADPVEVPPGEMRPKNLSYVIYTSGSTGRPKAAMNEHLGIVNYLFWIQEVFGQTPEDRVLQLTPLTFDVSVWEFFWPLLVGARLVMAVPGGHKDPAYLVKTVIEEGITTAHFVPSMLQAFVEQPGVERCTSLKRVIASGEALPFDLQQRFFARLGAGLHNLYGPCETAVDSTFWSCERDGSRRTVPIGRPVANTTVYILDPGFRRVPVGVVGELAIGGVQVGRGYLGRPELTAEKFVPDPFSGEPGSRLYRTGDLTKWNADGTIEFLGRVDFQVKLRGQRIELGEIEAALNEQPGVRESVVMALERGGEKRLVAFVVSEAGRVPVVEEMRGVLGERLPDYMVPAAFVVLDAMPLIPNGKADRKALAGMAEEAWSATQRAPYAAPRTPLEEMVAGIWSEVLGTDQVGREDDFFDLGGHSLLAMKLVSRYRETFQIDLPLREVFEEPTLSGQALLLDSARSVSVAPPLAAVPRGGALPPSFSQERLWFLDQLQPGSAAYNVPGGVRLRGALNADALRRSLTEVVRRHEVLRTVFAVRAGRPVQVVRDDLRPGLPLADLSALPQTIREVEIRRLSAEEAGRPFDLAVGPLLRHTLLRVGQGEHVLLLTFHHIVSDAWSLDVFLGELAALYPAFSAGRPSPLPELAVQYADFAHWQRGWLDGAVLEAELAWWHERLAGVPVLQLPTDRPRPSVQGFQGAMHFFSLPEPLSAELRSLSRAQRVTVFMSLLAAFQALLSRHAGQEDFAVGSPVAGRDVREVEPLIGFFVNTLVLRARLEGAPEFTKLLERVRLTSLEVYAHQSVPFEKIVQEIAPERNLSYTPLFQVMLAYQNLPQQSVDVQDLNLAPVHEEFPVSKFDITLTVFDSGSHIFGQWVYSTALFEAETIARWAGHLQVFLEGMAADPGARISELPLLNGAEREQLLVDWNRPAVEYPDEGFVHRMFEEQAGRTPETVAVVFAGEALSYGGLNARANRLARHLRRLGAGPETLVGISAERSFEMVVGLLAILKAGSAYVPLDPSLPAERLAYMIEDAGIGLLLDQERLLAIEGEAEEESEENLTVPVLPENPAYVIYTS